MEVLSAEGIQVTLGGRDVVRGVDLTLQAGTVTALLGPSGSGKSTLFRVLSGDLAPTGGRVTWFGEDVTHHPPWRRARAGLRWAPQQDAVLLGLTVEENLEVFARVLGMPRGRAREHAAGLGLERSLGVRAERLSGGERKRLGLLRVLLGPCRALLLDEPLAGLDPLSVERVGDLVRRRAAAGVAVLVADHRAAVLLDLASSAHLLVDGRVEASGAAEGFGEHPGVRRRYLGG